VQSEHTDTLSVTRSFLLDKASFNACPILKQSNSLENFPETLLESI
jgi:hypothetical protein